MQVRVVIACIANSEMLTRKRPLEELASSMSDISQFFGAVPKTSKIFDALGFDAGRINQMQVRGPALGAGW
jgi:hypothetical protein